MYIAAPPGTKMLARNLMPHDEYEVLEEVDFNVYGEEKSLAILQFMRDLKWIYISYDEGDKISLKPTATGIEIFEKGLTDEYMESHGDIVNLIKGYLSHYLKNDTGLTDETLKLADFYMKAGNYNRALDLASNLIEIGNKDKDYRLLGRGHYIYGTINMYRMDMDFAKSHFDKAVMYSENVDDISNVAKCYSGFGSYYGYKGDAEKAMQSFEKSLLLFKEIDDHNGVNQVKMNEAFALAKMGNIKEFFTLNHEAIDYFNGTTDRYHLQWCYQNESAVFLSLGKYDAAIDAVVEAHQLAKETGNEMMQNRSGLSIALIYIYTMRPGDAYEYVDNAMAYFRKNFDTNGLGSTYMSYMAYDVATKNLASADKNLEKSIQNFMVKRQLNYIADALSIYIRVMKLYRLSPITIEQKLKEFNKIAENYRCLDLFKLYLKED